MSWTGAVLTLALAALLHLLVCAHGPVSPGPGAGTARVDTLSSAGAVASTGCGQAAVPAAQAGVSQAAPADGGVGRCADADEPAVQAPRDIAAPPPAAEGAPAEPGPVPAAGPGRGHEYGYGYGYGRPPGAAGGQGAGGVRARLGVWRT
ncbi:hypothetical protein OG264_02980 [Streptomyces xanthophaeus]|uniref:hypothetical protein n=1 Tax=Streptomyces xanthophaeus TaxID=67385 RepID=UPI00386DFBBA|nr:hypothetical protein OG264_02980 [Streptomyces xanthophaeus]WST64460.1 hypothetical protein OG605_35380 [Streptomyces xanthophaeus]